MRVNLRNSKLRNLFLTMMLIVAMALTVVGCGKNAEGVNTESPRSEESSDSGQQPGGDSDDGQQSAQDTQSQGKVTILGEGKTGIQLVVVDKDGNETNFEIHTDKENVGEALLEYDLIKGDESEYGLYVKQVNGITADYDVDQTYWAFYINGEYASAGVDSTPVKEGETYTFKIEK